MLTEKTKDKDLKRVCVLATLKTDDMLDSTTEAMESDLDIIRNRLPLEVALEFDKLNVKAVEKICLLDNSFEGRAGEVISQTLTDGEEQTELNEDAFSTVTSVFDDCVATEEALGASERNAYKKCLKDIILEEEGY